MELNIDTIQTQLPGYDFSPPRTGYKASFYTQTSMIGPYSKQQPHSMAATCENSK